MRLRTQIALLLALGVSSLAWAVTDGGQPAAWRKLATGARPAGMGGAGAALGGDAYGYLLNPAVLAKLESMHLGSQLANLPPDRELQSLSLARPLSAKRDGLYTGLGFQRMGLSQAIEGRVGNTPAPSSTFTETQSQWSLGTALWFVPGVLAGGLGGHLLQQQLSDATASGYGLDFGLLASALPGLDFALSLQDVMGNLAWSTQRREIIPITIRMGVAWEARPKELLFAADLDRNLNQELRARFGGEWWPIEWLALRAGSNDWNWTAGLGARWRQGRMVWGLDYATGADPAGGLAHRVSLDLLADFLKL